MLLAQVLKRDSNNLDLVRLIAACLVIYGHANAFLPPERAGGDWVAGLLGFDYSGSLAVKVFFFLSGLVVTNSLLEKRSLLQFAIARVLRIWPALIAVLLGCALIIGPLVTSMPLREYLLEPQTRAYVWDGLRMHVGFVLPGVFDGHITNAVNGSLWSIPHEVNAYWVLAGAFALGLHRFRWLAVPVTIFIIIDPLLSQRLLFSWRTPNAAIDALAPCFAAGALMALFKDYIRIGPNMVFGCLVLFFAFKQAPYAHYLFYAALFFGLLYVFSRPLLVAWRPSADVSYGVYLWGWPIQQLLVHVFPDMGVQWHRLYAIALACGMGWASWHLLEKHFVLLGRQWYERLKTPARA